MIYKPLVMSNEEYHGKTKYESSSTIRKALISPKKYFCIVKIWNNDNSYNTDDIISKQIPFLDLKKMLYKSNDSNTLEKIANKKVYLFSALGDNESFKKIMGYTDAKIVGHSKYPDHYQYTLDDLNDIEQKATKCNAEFLITTEKDLVKINPQNRKIDIYTVRMKMIFKPDKLFNEYIDNLLS